MVIPILFLFPVLGDSNYSYVQNVSELPEINYSSVVPNKTIQSYKHIIAWVDIAGFEHTAKIGSNYYSNNTSDAVVLSDVKANLTDCPSIVENGCGVVAIYKNVNISQSGNQTIARLDVTLYWYFISCGIACIKIEQRESAQFHDYAISPLQFPLPGIQDATVERYNGTGNKNLLRFNNLSSSIIGYDIVTSNGTVSHWFKMGTVEENNGIPYMNLTSWDSWNNTGSGITHYLDDVLMENTSFYVNFYTPFGRIQNVTLNTTVIDMPKTSIQPSVFKLLYIILVFFVGIFIMFKSARS